MIPTIAVLINDHFVDVGRGRVMAAGLMPNQHNVVTAIYPEMSQSRHDHAPTAFPATCPCCGSAASKINRDDTWAYKRGAWYACGGAYTMKSQIQNHTDKWWGSCPDTQAKIVALVP